MTKTEKYREVLQGLVDWEPYLLAQSGLPGPRGNIELAVAASEIGSPAQFEYWLTFDAQRAPVNTSEEFLAFCGVLGLGQLAAHGKYDLLTRLRHYANDPRWRVREAVAMAVQQLGDVNIDLALQTAEKWSAGNWLEKRAAVASVAEPRLLKDERVAKKALDILDEITTTILKSDQRQGDDFRVLRQALGYAWSVVVVASPEEGRLLIQKWCSTPDKDIIWIMKENLKKNRLMRMDINWVNQCLAKLQTQENKSGGVDVSPIS
jgi:hypothetical protein